LKLLKGPQLLFHKRNDISSISFAYNISNTSLIESKIYIFVYNSDRIMYFIIEMIYVQRF